MRLTENQSEICVFPSILFTSFEITYTFINLETSNGMLFVHRKVNTIIHFMAYQYYNIEKVGKSICFLLISETRDCEKGNK